ncbi:MAG: UTP--glucose-1-phosphate uridylyltransferase [Lentisphaeria bacterium]|nr:UTP--glucose-1-phosphate uridylyltransferase [Lentisphaeria bacterium]
MSIELKNKLLGLLEKVGQEHVLRFWQQLDPAGQQRLAAQILSVDWQQCRRWIEDALQEEAPELPFERLQPSPYQPLAVESAAEQAFQRDCIAQGEELLRQGRLAAFTVAGGQGSRLGFDGPKGTYAFTALRKASLFQFFAESLLRYQEIYQTLLPWYIMTSPANDQATREFFAHNGFFGLDPAHVSFFQQGTLPAFDLQGKALLEAPDSLALSANGHGGSFAALKDSGALEDMRRRGVQLLSYWQVDNPLVRLFDPLFIGMHALSGSEMSSRALLKRDPLEKLGHFCTLDGRELIVEYSDMPEELLYAKDKQGRLLYRAGSPAIHLLNCDFIATLCSGSLNFKPHRALKKVPCIDERGRRCEPERENAIKLEFFLFDALPLARKTLVLEAERSEQFAPIKNAEGEDSPESCRQALLERSAGWVEAAGLEFPRDAEGKPAALLEVSPRHSVDRDDFLRRAEKPSGLTCGAKLVFGDERFFGH